VYKHANKLLTVVECKVIILPLIEIVTVLFQENCSYAKIVLRGHFNEE